MLIVLVIASGCTTRLADFTMISTRNVELDRVDLDSLPRTRGVSGEDSRFIFLFIPFGSPHLEEAIDDALEKGGGDVMTDAVMSSTIWWFLIGQNTLRVKGTVIDSRRTMQ